MCLAAFAIGASARYPLVVVSNRDEFHDRRAAPLAWWTPPGTSTPILAGRDLQAGGTWMGVNRAGRLALLTNIRDPAAQRADAPSRGELVAQWLTAERAGAPITAEALNTQALAAGHNGFNLIVADLARGGGDEPGDAGAWHWIHNGTERGMSAGSPPRAQPLTQALHGLSNGPLDAPWPKVRRLRQRLYESLQAVDAAGGSADALAATLLQTLTDRHLAADAELPQTGVPLALERALSAVFIHLPERGYGTRCSTVLITERLGAAPVGDGAGRSRRTTLWEQSFHADGTPGTCVQQVLADWPPGRARPPCD
ncbi:MAG: NRDE family protein [Leptothrix sp. (in: b-proteobacteria)]